MQIAELRNVTHDFESRLRLVELAGSPRSEYNLSAVIQQAVNSVVGAIPVHITAVGIISQALHLAYFIVVG